MLSPGWISTTLDALESSLRRSNLFSQSHSYDGPYSYLNVDPEMEKKYPLSDTQVRYYAAKLSLYSRVEPSFRLTLLTE